MPARIYPQLHLRNRSGSQGECHSRDRARADPDQVGHDAIGFPVTARSRAGSTTCCELVMRQMQSTASSTCTRGDASMRAKCMRSVRQRRIVERRPREPSISSSTLQMRRRRGDVGVVPVPTDKHANELSGAMFRSRAMKTFVSRTARLTLIGQKPVKLRFVEPLAAASAWTAAIVWRSRAFASRRMRSCSSRRSNSSGESTTATGSHLPARSQALASSLDEPAHLCVLDLSGKRLHPSSPFLEL